MIALFLVAARICELGALGIHQPLLHLEFLGAGAGAQQIQFVAFGFEVSGQLGYPLLLVEIAQAGAEVTAIDLSERSLDIARQRAEVYSLSNIHFYHGSAEELSSFLPVQSYDLIYSFGVIHHTPNPERVIEQLRRYCRPGTVLRVMLYHRYSWKALEILVREGQGAFWRFSELVEHHSEAQTGCPVTFTYTRRSIRKLLRGFVVDSVSIDHIFPYRIPDYVQYRYVKFWYFRPLPRFAFRWLEKTLGWHMCINAHFPADQEPRSAASC